MWILQLQNSACISTRMWLLENRNFHEHKSARMPYPMLLILKRIIFPRRHQRSTSYRMKIGPHARPRGPEFTPILVGETSW
jgi:hypothetical protein